MVSIVLKGFVSGAKRGFSDTINGGSGKWVYSGSGGSEVNLANGGGLFSPRGANGAAKSIGAGGVEGGSHQWDSPTFP